MACQGICPRAGREGNPRAVPVQFLFGSAALTDQEQEQIRSQIPLRRAGTPEDVAGVVAFLVSPQANYITGQVIRINGGLYM